MIGAVSLHWGRMTRSRAGECAAAATSRQWQRKTAATLTAVPNPRPKCRDDEPATWRPHSRRSPRWLHSSECVLKVKPCFFFKDFTQISGFFFSSRRSDIVAFCSMFIQQFLYICHPATRFIQYSCLFYNVPVGLCAYILFECHWTKGLVVINSCQTAQSKEQEMKEKSQQTKIATVTPLYGSCLQLIYRIIPLGLFIFCQLLNH